jgi:hypothetical protein
MSTTDPGYEPEDDDDDTVDEGEIPDEEVTDPYDPMEPDES